MKQRSVASAGFSLVEVTLAIGITAFALMVLIGLLPIGLTSNQDASQETEACHLLSQVASDLRATPQAETDGQPAESLQYGISIPASPLAEDVATTLYFDEFGEHSANPGATSVYRMEVTFRSNSATGAPTATLAHVRIAWPAVAPEPSGEVETLIAMDRN